MDITERIQAEEELRHSQALLNATQSLAHIGGWEWDTRNQTMTWTAETFRIHGLAPKDRPILSAELIDRSMDCYLPEDRTTIAEAFRRWWQLCPDALPASAIVVSLPPHPTPGPDADPTRVRKLLGVG